MSLYICCRSGNKTLTTTDPSEVISIMDKTYVDYPGSIHNSINTATFSAISRSTPIFDENRKFEGVFNLEPDNLIITGYARVDYRSDVLRHFGINNTDQWSDERLVAHIWVTFGTNALDCVAGDYSVVVFNPDSKETHIIRSALGNYPCFYYLSSRNGMCLIASTLLPILKNGLETPEPNVDYLMMSRMGLQFSTRETETQWKSVFSASAGSVTTIFTDNSIKVERFWFPERLTPLQYSNENDYFEHFLELFNDAITQRLHPHANHGGFMSGGFDSSSVSVIAHKLLQKAGKSYKAFTSVPAYPETMIPRSGSMQDESIMTKYILRDNPEMLHQYVRSEHFGPLDAMKLDMQSNGMYTMNLQNNFWFFETYRLAHESGIQILLNGNLGNLTMSWDGYDVYKGYLLQGKYGSLIRDLISNCVHGNTNPLSTLLADIRKTITIGQHLSFNSLVKSSEFNIQNRIESIQQPIDVQKICAEVASLFSNRIFSNGLPDTFSMKYRWFLLVRQSVITTNLDYLASLGVEMRDPTIDKRVSEFCLRMPLNMFYRKGVRRYFARTVFYGILPDELIKNRKRGLQAADIPYRVNLQVSNIEKEITKPIRILPFKVKVDDVLQNIDQLKKDSNPTINQQDVIRVILGTASLFVQDEFIYNSIHH